MRPPVGVAIAALGITQIVGWGTTHYMPAILAGPIANGLGLSPTAVLGGFSWGLLVAGLSARAGGRLMDRHGARRVMTLASILAAAGLCAISLAETWAALYAGWTLIGLAMRSILYDGAFAALTVLAGGGARRAISLLTLFGGFASSVFWPIGAWLDATLGWRGALQIYALLNLLPCALLHAGFAGGPQRHSRSGHAAAESASGGIGLAPPRARTALQLATAGFTLHAFIASAMSAHLVILLNGFGFGPTVAVAAASLMGAAQVAARIAEMSLQRRFSAIAVAVPSVALLPAAFVAALVLPAAPWTAALFVAIFGCANGLMTVVRGSLPLAVFGSRGYGELLGRIAAPGLLAAAAAPVTFSALVEAAGPRAGLVLLAAFGIGALASIVLLARLARHAEAPGPGAS